jgi:hypothetical protein
VAANLVAVVVVVALSFGVFPLAASLVFDHALGHRLASRIVLHHLKSMLKRTFFPIFLFVVDHRVHKPLPFKWDISKRSIFSSTYIVISYVGVNLIPRDKHSSFR